MENGSEHLETTTPVIQLQGLTRSFGPLKAVDALDLDIHSGEVLGILGPNGAGKTTTIRMICGLLEPSSGRLEFNLEEGHRFARVRHRVGVCPQENRFWPRLTCHEQLQLMGSLYGLTRARSRKRSQSLLEALGLAKKRNVQARTLSGGMKRRLSLALALVHDPSILILDEPEAGLDPQSRLLVREFILQQAHRKTVILTTHNMDEADRLSTRVAIIDEGKLLVVDSPEDLKRSLGAGDLLEIELAVQPTTGAETKLRALIGQDIHLDLKGPSLKIRALDLVEKLPGVYALLQELDLQPRSMHLRENTLEDVFIHLTGKQLRS